MKKLLLFLFLLPLCGFAQLSDATLLLHDSTQIKQLGTSQLRSWQMFKEVIQSKVNVSNGITTSGLTTGYIPYATSATTLGNSELSRITANLYGLIGITNSAERFSIVNSSSGSNAFSTLLLSSDGTPSSITQYGVNGLAPNRLDIGNAGGEITLTTPIGSFVGINITPSRELHVALMDATTNSVGIVQRLTKLSSGTAAIGIGSGLELGAVNSVGLQKVGSSIESPFTSVANTNESADFVIKNISTGTLTERLRVTSAGAIGLSGANYGTSGQVLTSGGPGAAVTWGAASGGNPFADNAALVKNSSDATKLLILSAASITTGTTRTWTFPDVNGTVARNDASQNFSGIQSFLGPASFYGVGPNGPQLTTGTYRGTYLSPTTILSGDALANIQFDGYDGTSYTIGAQILAVSTGTIATGKIGTRLTFLTSTTAGSLNTALTITESQVVTFAQLPTIPVTPVASTDAVSKGYLDGLTLGPFSTTLNGYTLTSGGAGKLLLGDNTWLAAGTSGKVLVSNGTTWVNSTPTFPNASATTRKIIVSDGTNWVASTETYAVPGTSGNVLTSNGTNWTSASPISAGWNLTGATNLTGPATVIGSSTNTLAWDFGNLGTTDTDGAGGLYTNTTAATSGTFNVSQNHSPSLAFKAFAWKSNATAASESSVMRVSNDPRQYTTGILGVFAIKSNINAGGDKYIFDVQKAEVGGTAMNIYDSYTNSTTYDRLVISSDFLGVGSGFAIIKDRPGSTGALYIGNEQDATVNMRVNAGNRWRFSTNAESYSFVPSTDNVSDIGVAGANRVRNVYGGNISLGIAGNGILIKEGTNATMGTATANGTTEVTVSTTKVTANSRVFFNCQSGCGTSSAYYVSSRIGATSFGFKAIGADTGTVAWFILEPAP